MTEKLTIACTDIRRVYKGDLLSVNGKTFVVFKTYHRKGTDKMSIWIKELR